MAWIDDAKRASVQSVAQALGFERRGQSFGPTCPACQGSRRSGKDRRMPLMVVGGGEGWRHFDSSCDVWGDSVDLVAYTMHGDRARNLSAEHLADVRAWFAHAGYCDGVEGQPAPVAKAPVRLEEVDPTPVYPPLEEVAKLWAASARPNALEYGFDPRGLDDHDDVDLATTSPDDDVHAYLERRGFDADTIAEHDLARIIPLEHAWPSWWPWGGRGVWRLAVLAFDAQGNPRSIHARAVYDDARKTRWPYQHDARGLLFACPLAHRLMLGERRRVDAVLVCEGLTDWLALASKVCSTGRQIAVFGAASGGFEALGAVRIPRRAPVRVLTDNDSQGERYAAAIARALPQHNVGRP